MMCKFRDQASTAIQCKVISLSYILAQSQQWVAKKTEMATLVMLLGLGGGLWISTEVVTPQTAQAETAHINLSLESQPDQTYETILSRAEEVAKTAAQARFDQNSRVTDVSIMVVAQNQGAIAPVLSLEVSRSQWRNRREVQRWSTYFTNARSLLGFEDVATTNPNQPGTATPVPSEQSENATPDSTTEGVISNPDESETANPTTPGQTPDSDTDFSPRPQDAVPVDPTEGNPESPTELPSSVSPGFPSTSTPTDPSQTPSVVPPTSGSTINNPTSTSIPDSSDISPNDNPAATPITPNGNVPETIQPNNPEDVNRIDD